jgi:RND family efflux transporter MFP subunit
MVKRTTVRIILAVLAVLLCGCNSTPSTPTTKPSVEPASKVSNRVKEGDLTQVTLSVEAEKRLGIEVVAVSEGSAPRKLHVAGDVVVIPGKAVIVSAPMAGRVAFTGTAASVGEGVRKGQEIFRLTPMLAPQRDLRTTYEADLQSAKSRLDTASQQLERAKLLLRDLAGSKRNVELADQEFGQAKAAYDAAQERLKRLETHPLEADVDVKVSAPSDGILRQVLVANGQDVAGGAPLFEVADLSSVWLRVPVYAGDLKSVGSAQEIEIRRIDGTGPVLRGRLAKAPPTADPLAVTSDLYFELANPCLQLRPGERLTAALPTRDGPQRSLALPSSAVLYDIHGSTWVYVNEAPHLYRRFRVEVTQTVGNTSFVSKGVTTGAKVVAQGAAELFGTEFGAGH